jgi:hypothetical protein
MISSPLSWGFLGFPAKEAIGGKIHLTNFRLIFKSHPFNRCTGTLSIWLPTIHDIRDTSSLRVKKCCVSTSSQDMEFVLFGAQSFVEVVKSARELFGIEQIKILEEYINSDPKKTRLGLSYQEGSIIL